MNSNYIISKFISSNRNRNCFIMNKPSIMYSLYKASFYNKVKAKDRDKGLGMFVRNRIYNLNKICYLYQIYLNKIN